MMVRAALAVVLALTAAASVPRQAGSAELPCGVLDPVDRLFECDGGTAGTGGEAPTSGAASVEERERSPRWSGPGAVQADPNRLLVRFEPGTSRSAAIRVAQDAGGSLERRLPALGLDVVRTEAERLQSVRRELERSSIVRAVTAEYLAGLTGVQPNDVHWPRQTGLHLAGFPEAWEATRGSAETVVAVIDTGVSSTHPDLAGAVLAGRDFFNGDDDPADDHGHGTAVAGVVAARSNNAVGIAGVCWLCKVLPVKVLSADGLGPTSAIAAGILWATDRGADVINLSLGTPQPTPALTGAVAYAAARGVLVVAAAGNDGVASPFYPAAEPGALAIAAIDERNTPYSWSNYGPWVQLAAPGCLPTTLSGGDYGVECGTSIAAPVVSGLAALALAARPTLTAAQLADVLRRGTVPIGSVVRDGRVDAARTVGMLAAARPALATVNLRSTLTKARSSRTFAVRGGGGTWTSIVTFDRRRLLTISMVDANGRVVARARGGSPLRLVRRLPAGLYRVRVSGPNGVFRLAVSRPEADSRTQAAA